MKKLLLLLVGCSTFTAYCQNERMLTAEEMQGDIAILQSAWASLHPGLYRYNTPEEVKGYFIKLNDRCSKPLPEKTFYVLLAQLAEKIRCGHTYLNPLNLENDIQQRLLPSKVIPLLFFIDEDRKMIVTHNLSDDAQIKPGDELMAINGISSRAIIDSLLTVSRSDGNNGLGKKIFNINETPDELAAYSLFDIFFPLFFDANNQSWSVSIRGFKQAKNYTNTLRLFSYADRQKKYEAPFGKVPAAEATWEYRMLDTKTAYMKFGTFSFWNSSFKPSQFVDSIFSDLLANTRAEHLVIDIRNNEGGDNTGDYILSYITDKKIGCNEAERKCYRYLSVPDTLKPYLDTWDSSFKKKKDSSLFFKNELGLYEKKEAAETCEYIYPQSSTFKGKVFLITNAKNSSAGYEMARDFKTNQLGVIAGQPTGGSRQGINGSQFFFLTLPNSKIEIDLPLVYSYYANQPDEGITPDHTILTRQEDIANNYDRQLNFVMSLVKK